MEELEKHRLIGFVPLKKTRMHYDFKELCRSVIISKAVKNTHPKIFCELKRLTKESKGKRKK